MAGLELARHLDHPSGPRTVVLEAGPSTDLRHVNAAHPPAGALLKWLRPSTDEFFWRPWDTASAPHYGLTAGLRRRMGGRSLYWHGVSLPLEDWALREPFWPASVVRDLTISWAGGPSLYDQVRADLAAWRAGPLAEPGPLVTIGRFSFLPTPQAIRSHPAGDGPRWRAYSPADYWADGPGRHSATVRVCAGLEVQAVAVRDGRAAGLVARDSAGQTRMLAAGRIVLAAGTIENTRLGLQALHEAGALDRRVRPGLADHMVHGVVGVLAASAVPPEVRAWAERDVFVYTPCPPDRSNLFLRISRNQAGAVVFDSWAMGEQRPGESCTVECVGDGGEPWRAVVHAGLSDADTAVVRAQRDRLAALWADFSRLLGREPAAPAFPDFDQPACMLEDVLPALDTLEPQAEPLAWSGPLGSEYHEAGTLPIGEILGDDLQFRGVPGLYAAGPCTFPRPGAANPSLTNLALSRRLAAQLSSLAS
jgi:choline dehydrogenase-like flavoprotein